VVLNLKNKHVDDSSYLVVIYVHIYIYYVYALTWPRQRIKRDDYVTLGYAPPPPRDTTKQPYISYTWKEGKKWFIEQLPLATPSPRHIMGIVFLPIMCAHPVPQTHDRPLFLIVFTFHCFNGPSLLRIGVRDLHLVMFSHDFCLHAFQEGFENICDVFFHIYV